MNKNNNNLINDIFNLLDKTKFYCNKCLKENIITELLIDPDDNNYLLFPNCEHNKCRPFYKVLWNENKQKWVCSQGLKINAITIDESSKKSKKSGRCSIKICGRYNKERDQNGRGRDIGYGIGEWIAENDILDESTGKIIVHKCEKCGCSCSKDFYQKHNSSDQMREQAKQMVLEWNSSDEFQEFIVKHNQSDKMKLISAENLHKNTLPGYCVNPLCHKWCESRTSTGLCKECIGKLNLPKFCIKCNSITPHKGKVCLICHPESRGINNICYYVNINPNCNIHKDCKNMFFNEKINKYECWECYKERFKENNCNINNNDKNNKFQMILPKKLKCKQCGKIVKNPNDKFCSEKCEKIYEEDKGKYFKRNNNCERHPNEILTYHEQCWSCYKEESLINNNIIIPNSCKCMNCNKTIDPNNNRFCSEKCKIEFTQSHKSIFKEGNKCDKHPYENLIYGKMCWSCYHEYILNNNFENNNNNNLFFKEIQKDYPSAYIQPTFRTQESEDWTGASSAFEQNLIENEIYYFTYVKFYIDQKDVNFIPLVVGKSGSKLVNEHSDVNFSINVNHGPARRFLNEEGLEWDKTKILIIPCKSEKEAYRIEKEIHDKFGLFYS